MVECTHICFQCLPISIDENKARAKKSIHDLLPTSILVRTVSLSIACVLSKLRVKNDASTHPANANDQAKSTRSEFDDNESLESDYFFDVFTFTSAIRHNDGPKVTSTGITRDKIYCATRGLTSISSSTIITLLLIFLYNPLSCYGLKPSEQHYILADYNNVSITL